MASPAGATSGVEELDHPIDGRRGVWIPAELWPEFERRYDLVPNLESQVFELKGERDALRLSITALRRTATTAQARADEWEERADLLGDQVFELRLRRVDRPGTFVPILMYVLGAATAVAVAFAGESSTN